MHGTQGKTQMSAAFAIQTYTRFTTLIMHNLDKSCHFNYVQILTNHVDSNGKKKKKSVPKQP